MLNGQQILITRFEKGCLKIDGKPKFLNEKCTFLGVLLLLTLFLVGAGIQMSIQEWTFLEGFYAYFITFTTVGFGDLIPGHESGNKAHMAYRVILIILGLAAMSNVINSIVKCEDSAKSRPLNNHTTTGLGHKFIESDSTAVLCTGSERGRN